MSAIDSAIINDLLIGEWQLPISNNGKLYEFLPNTDIVIYSDYDFPKAEAATFSLKTIDDKHQLEIRHPNKKLKTEVYEIVSIDHKKMIWAYVEGENVKQIKLMKFLG